MKPRDLIYKSPSAIFAVMTKDLVDDLLILNTRNRNLQPNAVAFYRRAIEAGHWVVTGEGISVSASGFLINGQHRLEALRAAGYPPLTMLLVLGLPDEALGAVDTGKNRSARDYLQLMFNAKVSNFVAALLRTSMSAAKSFAPGKFLPQEYAEKLEELGPSIEELLEIEGLGKLPAAVVAALMDAHHKGYRDDTLAFAKALASGEMLERDNPALVLRNWIANNKGPGGELVMTERYRKTTNALQAWIDRRPLSKLYRKKSPLIRTAMEAA